MDTDGGDRKDLLQVLFFPQMLISSDAGRERCVAAGSHMLSVS